MTMYMNSNYHFKAATCTYIYVITTPFPTSECPLQPHISFELKQGPHTLIGCLLAVSDTVGWYCPRGSRTCLQKVFITNVIHAPIIFYWIPSPLTHLVHCLPCTHWVTNLSHHCIRESSELHHLLKTVNGHDIADHHKSHPEVHHLSCVFGRSIRYMFNKVGLQ